MSDLHETHVCRDCGVEITMPYVRETTDRDAAVKAERTRIVASLGRVMVFEPCGGYGCAWERAEDWDTVLAVVRNEPVP